MNKQHGGYTTGYNNQSTNLNPSHSTGLRPSKWEEVVKNSAHFGGGFNSRVRPIRIPTSQAKPDESEKWFENMEKENNPIVRILACFQSIPKEYHASLFQDFRDAADSKNLRTLLDMISDWAATAELYANPTLLAEVEEARAGRKGIEDWLHSK